MTTYDLRTGRIHADTKAAARASRQILKRETEEYGEDVRLVCRGGLPPMSTRYWKVAERQLAWLYWVTGRRNGKA